MRSLTPQTEGRRPGDYGPEQRVVPDHGKADRELAARVRANLITATREAGAGEWLVALIFRMTPRGVRKILARSRGPAVAGPDEG